MKNNKRKEIVVMKKMFLVCLIAAMVLLMADSFSVSAENVPKLSELSDEECVFFLQENGVEIPVSFDEEIDWSGFTKAIVKAIESNPNITFPFGYAVLNKFVESVRSVVNGYYGEGSVNAVANVNYIIECATSSQGQEVTSLRDSDPFCGWSDVYSKYNCYAYAIDRYDSSPDSGEDYAIDPGMLHGNGIGNNTTISEIAQRVQSDLEWLGYTVLENTTTCPTIEISSHTHLICVRKDVDGYLLPIEDNEGNVLGYYLLKDYHFMRLSVNGNWYHKTGRSCPLRYLYTPTNDRNWINEGRDVDGLFQYTDWTYDSEIYYIAYSTPHKWEQTTTNYNGTHTLTCTICGDTMQESCDLDYTCVNNFYHKGTCADCGYSTSNISCEGTYTYAGNGSGRHTATCGICGASTQFGCTLEYIWYHDSQHRVACTVCNAVFYESCDLSAVYTGNGTTSHTHAMGCDECGHVTATANAACTFASHYAYAENGVNYHRDTCDVCGYRKSTVGRCVYKNSNHCFLCGAPKDSSMAASTQEAATAE